MGAGGGGYGTGCFDSKIGQLSIVFMRYASNIATGSAYLKYPRASMVT